MADVKICDRCGKKIETRIWPLIVSNFRTFLKIEGSIYRYEYDLCRSCTAKFHDFMKGEATDTIGKE